MKKGARHDKRMLYLRDLFFGDKYKLDGESFRVPRATKFAARKALYKGTYELPERQLIMRYLPEDIPVVELRCSFGIVSRFIRNKIGHTAKHVMVEANPTLLDVTRMNYRGFDDNTCKLITCAVSSEGLDSIRFCVTAGFHDSRILGENESPSKPEDAVIEVPVRSLQSLIDAEIGSKEYSLVCDIEGAEFAMFRDDKSALGQCVSVVVEVHPRVFEIEGHSVAQFEAFVTDCGFDIVERDANVIAAVRNA